MKQLLAALIIALSLCAGARAAALPDVSAPSVALMEKETGTLLFARDEHTPREPASVTKIMTILLTMEAIDSGALSYDTVVTTSAHASSMGGSQIWLREGEQMTVEEMLKAVCVVSANDCAVALGEYLSGSEDAFVERMNRRARELGMNDTTFKNATGLPAVGHVTSAYDIALMSRELILRHPDIRKFTTIWMDSLRGGTSVLVNTNKLLRTYDGATGLKTGSTGSARYCLSATAERDGMELIAVILRGETSVQRFDDAKTLLSYGFANYALRSVEPETPLPPVPVKLGASDSVDVAPDGDALLLLDKEKAVLLRQEVTLETELEAPVSRGTRVGTLTAYAGDELLAEIPLVAADDVPRVTYAQLFFRVLRAAFLGPDTPDTDSAEPSAAQTDTDDTQGDTPDAQAAETSGAAPLETDASAQGDTNAAQADTPDAQANTLDAQANTLDAQAVETSAAPLETNASAQTDTP